MMIMARVWAADGADIHEIDAACDAIRQALAMTVAAVPFLTQADVNIYDDDMNIVPVPETVSDDG